MQGGRRFFRPEMYCFLCKKADAKGTPMGPLAQCAWGRDGQRDHTGAGPCGKAYHRPCIGAPR